MTATSPARTSAHIPGVDLRTACALASIYILWGTTFLAVRIAVAELPPFLLAGARFLVAGAVLLAASRSWPSRRQWLAAIPLGALFFVVGNGLVVVAETELPSSVAAVVCATTPLLASGLGALYGERPSRRE